MGMSVSAASAIVFISFCVIFGVVFGALHQYTDHLIDSQDRTFDRYVDQRDSKISILNIDTANDTIEMLNQGSVALDTGDTDLLLNGTLINANITGIEIVGHPESSIWAPNDHLLIHLDREVDGARLKAIAGTGATAYYG